jgi:hypothetical protein
VREEEEPEDDKIILNEVMPFFFKHLDFDQSTNFYKLIVFRLFQAIFLTSNMAHPDEYW